MNVRELANRIPRVISATQPDGGRTGSEISGLSPTVPINISTANHQEYDIHIFNH
jgi:hypothetical protein